MYSTLYIYIYIYTYCAFVGLYNKEFPPYIALALFLYAVGHTDPCVRVLEADGQLLLAVFMLQDNKTHTLHSIQFQRLEMNAILALKKESRLGITRTLLTQLRAALRSSGG